MIIHLCNNELQPLCENEFVVDWSKKSIRGKQTFDMKKIDVCDEEHISKLIILHNDYNSIQGNHRKILILTCPSQVELKMIGGKIERKEMIEEIRINNKVFIGMIDIFFEWATISYCGLVRQKEEREGRRERGGGKGKG